jgi:uncharacterized protein YjaZ
MKKVAVFIMFSVSLLILVSCNNLKNQNKSSKYVITKENGRIIKAYMAFEDFLNSDKSWESYKKILLDAYPEMLAVHNKQLSWGSIDSVKFPEEVKNYKKEDWEKYFNQYDDKTLNFLYDSIIVRANKVLMPVKHTPVDLCMFLPYGGCFIISENGKCTIYISLDIDPNDVQKIMVHEYAHNLHIQRRPDEPFRLKREVVSEGMAVYLTTLILKDLGINKAIPFMPESSVKWCFENEQLIKDSIRVELNDSTFLSLKKFIADGPGMSAPPKGFVEKTAYFSGYRIIEACIKKGMKLEDICSLNSDSVIARSGYFN